MAGSIIKIETELGVLDLFQGAEREFYVTRQMNDLHNLESRNADFSKTIRIPPTPGNTAILDAYAADGGRTIPCRILIDDITISPSAKLLFGGKTISNDEISYEVTVLYGNFSLFDDILEGTIDEMDWSDLSYQHTVNNYVQLSQETETLVTPIVDWLTRDSEPSVLPQNAANSQGRYLEINTGGFFVYAKEIIRRLIAEAGYTMEVVAAPADFYSIALACPIDKFFETVDVSELSFSATVISVSTLIYDGVTQRITFDGGNEEPWNPATNQWEFTQAGDVRVNLQGTYSIDHGTASLPPSAIHIYLNGAIVETFELSLVDVTDQSFYIGVDLTITPGDFVWYEVEAQAGGNNDVVTLLPQVFGTANTPGADVSRNIQPTDWIPQIGKSTFFANILKLFNLIIRTDEITKKVFIQDFNDLYAGEEQDLTSLLDVGFNEVAYSYSIDSMAQNTKFKWGNDNLLRRDAEYEIRFDNQLLAKEVTAIEMDFSMCDNSVLLFDRGVDGDNFLKAKIPNCNVSRTDTRGSLTNITANPLNGDYELTGDPVSGLKVGAWITVNIDGAFNIRTYRITAITDDTHGTLQTPVDDIPVANTGTVIDVAQGATGNPQARLAIIRSDGNEDYWFAMNGSQEPYPGGLEVGGVRAFLPSSLTANFMDSLKWENITATYYANLLDALQTPEVIKAWFNLNTVVFVELDFMRPVYIEEFNAFYYINKIEQFKPNQKTRLELVRISRYTR